MTFQTPFQPLFQRGSKPYSAPPSDAVPTPVPPYPPYRLGLARPLGRARTLKGG